MAQKRTLQVDDVLRQGWTQVDNSVLFDERLTPSDILVYSALCAHDFAKAQKGRKWRRKGRAWPSQARLAAETGLSERSVRRSLKSLQEAGHIRIMTARGGPGGGGRTIYYLRQSTEAPPQE